MIRWVDETTKPPFTENALEDIDSQHVLTKRDLIITNMPYPAHSWRDRAPRRPSDVQTRNQAREWIFRHGPVVCRCIETVFLDKKGRSYEGALRAPFQHECDEQPGLRPFDARRGATFPGDTQEARHKDEGRELVERLAPGWKGKQHDHCQPPEVVEPRRNRKPEPPRKPVRYTFGDVFCGAGGATQGAIQAGLAPLWGVERDPLPM